jgi:hypothetical protein
MTSWAHGFQPKRIYQGQEDVCPFFIMGKDHENLCVSIVLPDGRCGVGTGMGNVSTDALYCRIIP